MAVDPNVPQANADTRRRLATVFTDSAQTDLFYAIDCAMVASDSDRAGYLEDVAEEYMQSAARKMRLAVSLCCLRP